MAPRNAHTYLKKHRLSGGALTFDLRSEAAALIEKANAAESGRAAKTLVKEGSLRLTVVALRKGTALERHKVEAPLSIQALSGRVRIAVGEERVDLSSGRIVTLEPGATHDAYGITDTAFVITMAMGASVT